MVNMEKAGGVRGLSHYHYWPNTAKRPHTANINWTALTCLIVRELKGGDAISRGQI